MRLTRKARWAAPGAAVIVVGGVIAASAITVAQASPALPPKTPAQLLADVASTQKVPPLTGTVVETTSLGLPALPQVGNPTSLASLLTGSHTVRVYFQDGKHFRLALPQAMSETDIIRSGGTVWLWESAANSYAKFTVPSGAPATVKAGALARKRLAQRLPTDAPLTPQQAADEALKAVGATTVVSVDSTLTVAGQAAYQLQLAPKDHRSTIGSVRIAIDGKTGVPLRVQVFARGAASPAFQVGYTDISYVAPDPANLTFTPPPGAKLSSGDQLGTGAGHAPAAAMGPAGAYGKGWLSVAELPQALLAGPMAAGAPGSATTPAGTGAFGKDSQAAIGALLGAAKPVHGAWGSGTLLHTTLVNILFVGNQMYLGAVDPSVLYAAVGHAAPVTGN